MALPKTDQAPGRDEAADQRYAIDQHETGGGESGARAHRARAQSVVTEKGGADVRQVCRRLVAGLSEGRRQSVIDAARDRSSFACAPEAAPWFGAARSVARAGDGSVLCQARRDE